MTRQQYTPEFKRRAVALLLESGKSVARMAQGLDIKENTLYNWKNSIRIRWMRREKKPRQGTGAEMKNMQK
ncbi:transposase [Pectobacterium polaris]|uniref:transposase n=1 Tax=Pectobacterium polaris TaxID=2042057 RepID=UPI000D60D7C1|nr:transposase [Pectobacterium polaris]MCL6327321.1 hypothetical protein [Pectobacterium polaris]MCU1789838.1 hypothetical protein [Pectobacterium polaris]PWD62842.1 hypothetical protein DF209_00910 [Pectobacterium polaris]